jgi:hypothetical protein
MDGTNNSAFTTKLAYISLHSADRDAPDAARIWGTRVPTKIKFFGWLLHFGRLSANPHRKKYSASRGIYCDFYPIFLSCPRVVSVWSMLGVEVQAVQHRAPWLLACSLPLQDDVRTNVFLTLLWHL